jgi:phosphonopyruvate decarboxylase
MMALDTELFIDRMVKEGYTHLCVVPCSFAKNLINASINSSDIEYLPCASEAVACSIAAGLKMSGKSPVVVIQSSGITNMGSCITSLLKPYGVTFPIITSWRTYKEGDSEIQHQHLATKLPSLIHAYGYEDVILDQKSIDKAMMQLKKCDESETIAILKKDTFTKVELLKEHQQDLSSYIPRGDFLKTLNTIFQSSNRLFIGTTGNTAREMYSFMPDTDNFYMAGNMGGALSLGFGAAMAGKKVIVCGGDAEFVMHMGGLTTAGRYKDSIDLTYILFDNASNKSTGGQNSYQSHVDYANIAKSSNFEVLKDDEVKDLEDFKQLMQGVKNRNGLKFIIVRCGLDDETPRPPLDIVKRDKF